MTTGYVVSGRGDLDVLFKARTSAGSVGATNFKSNGGVDLNVRFEPRGATPPITDTGFKVGAQDLAALFMGISATPTFTFTMVAGTLGGNVGYSDGLSFPDMPGDSISTTALGANDISGLVYSSGNSWLVLKHASVAPANTDSSWISYAVTGVFANSAGATVTRNFTRAATSYSTSGVAGNLRGNWNMTGTAAQYINGNTYSISIVKS